MDIKAILNDLLPLKGYFFFLFWWRIEDSTRGQTREHEEGERKPIRDCFISMVEHLSV
jgi:hypothetical protein